MFWFVLVGQVGHVKAWLRYVPSSATVTLSVVADLHHSLDSGGFQPLRTRRSLSDERSLRSDAKARARKEQLEQRLASLQRRAHEMELSQQGPMDENRERDWNSLHERIATTREQLREFADWFL